MLFISFLLHSLRHLPEGNLVPFRCRNIAYLLCVPHGSPKLCGFPVQRRGCRYYQRKFGRAGCRVSRVHCEYVLRPACLTRAVLCPVPGFPLEAFSRLGQSTFFLERQQRHAHLTNHPSTQNQSPALDPCHHSQDKHDTISTMGRRPRTPPSQQQQPPPRGTLSPLQNSQLVLLGNANKPNRIHNIFRGCPGYPDFCAWAGTALPVLEQAVCSLLRTESTRLVPIQYYASPRASVRVNRGTPQKTLFVGLVICHLVYRRTSWVLGGVRGASAMAVSCRAVLELCYKCRAQGLDVSLCWWGVGGLKKKRCFGPSVKASRRNPGTEHKTARARHAAHINVQCTRETWDAARPTFGGSINNPSLYREKP